VGAIRPLVVSSTPERSFALRGNKVRKREGRGEVGQK
jgi:hypothetical protein